MNSWVGLLAWLSAHAGQRIWSSAARHLWPCFPSRAELKAMSNSYVRLWFCFPAWVGHRMCSTTGTARWLGVQIRQNYWVPGQTRPPAQFYRMAAVWDIFLDTTTNRNIVHQDLSTGCSKPSPPFPSLSGLQRLSSEDSPSDPMERELNKPSRKHHTVLGMLDNHLEFSLTHWRNCGPLKDFLLGHCAALWQA